MDEEELQDNLRQFPAHSVLPRCLRSFLAVYLTLALTSLLLLLLSALALARVSSISSKLHQEPPERNFSDLDSFLFPCGADSREWEYFSGHCYYFSLARLSWEQAREQFWREGEPNDSGRNEDCAHLWTWGQWNDVHCTFECFFVCERPLAPN
ncbi:hypothetical protein IHE44_0010968 [Lamprotornis superbus]|uniref:C-type lectin domain-containing protein n=1 Tax=Lamprotornis superbus TaxID=245042 RepID=A0A835TM97_9PASS|nr:hypothetical protein IHE44_0010968 [Lamprotornis superbus]